MIKRKILALLETHLSSDQMSIIIGPRQVGKTYLMDVLRQKLEAKGQKTVWLNLDNEEDRKKFTSQADIISFLELSVGKRKSYIFIDEIQRKKDAGLFLKGIFDMNLPYKFIVSGSGSLELKAQIPESMAGRKQLFYVKPVSFAEFVNHRTDYQYDDRLQQFLALEEKRASRLLSEYMAFGGYPRIVLAETAALKQSQMQELYRSYIDRDIRDLLNLEKTDAFTDLLKIISSQIGSLVNVTGLASATNLDVKTINKYLWYLEQTFIIRKVTPYFRSPGSEITKMPIYYFVDVGFRNWLLGLFGLSEIPRSLSGHLFENIVFNTLFDQFELSPTHIHFWRTRDKAEVDFIIKTGLETVPIEVKYTKLSEMAIPRSLRSFITKYAPKKGYIIHTGNGSLQKAIENTTLKLMPYWSLIFSAQDINPEIDTA